ncbi:Kinetochore protein Nuf2 [Penicillium lividum]|nr:Kinetochore protein Nuf2 [Penicillium lividum]
MARNDELKARLLDLRREQSQVAENIDHIKYQRARRQQQLEEKTQRLVRTRREAERLQPYALESAVTLQSLLSELAGKIRREKSQIDGLQKRARELQTSSELFTVASNNVQTCVTLLEEISTEMQKEDEEKSRAARNKEAISDQGASVRDIEQTEKLLQRQLAHWDERIGHLHKNAQEKAELAQTRMEELLNVQQQLREERAEKQIPMEQIRIRTERTEKKMEDLKENIESEIQAANSRYLQLASRIELYMTELEPLL